MKGHQLQFLTILLELMGIINLELENFAGALRSFQRMKDFAEERKDDVLQMRSLKLLGKTLGAQTDHKQAIVVLKHLL